MNIDRYLLSHRKEVAVEAVRRGWRVTLLARDTGHSDEVKSLGVEFIDTKADPVSTNPLKEMRYLRFLEHYYMDNRNAIVHHVGLKSILWGSIAARRARVKGVVNAVAGLGILFGVNSNKGVRGIIDAILRIGNNSPNQHYIFQNLDDADYFKRHLKIDYRNITYIKGSGVNLEQFTPALHNKKDKIRVIFTGRMIKEKGVLDLIEAADILRPRWENKVEFLLCGGLYKSPQGLGEKDLMRRCDNKYIRWIGDRMDIADLLRQSDIMAFPSYYREGMPKSLLEASAAGLPIVTTDSIGCRETVIEGVNGFKVHPGSAKMLALRLETLLSNRELRVTMGEKSRLIAERDYDIEGVVEKHLQIYDKLNSIV